MTGEMDTYNLMTGIGSLTSWGTTTLPKVLGQCLRLHVTSRLSFIESRVGSGLDTMFQTFERRRSFFSPPLDLIFTKPLQHEISLVFIFRFFAVMPFH